ncbi:MAG: SIMPL domain-containing protein [Proteobacteria bacterium]|nr:SIMPL domain-containing protein [Pseudomonadota bacterium]
MGKSVAFTVMFLMGLMIGPAYGLSPSGQSLNVIQTEGIAEVSGRNDSMTLSIAVLTKGKDMENTALDNSNRVKGVLSAIQDLKIKNLRMKTADFRVTPVRDYQSKPPVISGYEVYNAIEVKMEEFEPGILAEYASKVIGAALGKGANTINYISAYIKNLDGLENEALTLATRKARQRSETIAKAAGVKIKKIVSIHTQPEDIPGPYKLARSAAMAEESGSMAPPVEIGESKVRVRVTMTVEIE